ncbi:unnamed protein product [Cyprideis torosa]|uniref:polynucleotide adenylyltransferase n=1 Tax=Cyprideis torosa TaxID=163714 RepID=A0A7R8WEC6_9CRUS|nr:unnamed protein product [Cyprideis torosa]CAG0889629.1 unnamed protein product [Cyprideis torosa]
MSRSENDFQKSETPWFIPEARGGSYLPHMCGLHQEIEDFYTYILPTAKESDLRCGVIKRIHEAIVSRWPNVYVDVFGSFRTGLYLPLGDIDLVVIGRWKHNPPYWGIANLLVEQGIVYPHQLKVLMHAKVPVIKIVDSSTNVRVDISFNNLNGRRGVTLVKEIRKKYPCFPKLVMVLKQFLSQRGLNEVFTGGISSYAIVLMVASFLDVHPRNHELSSPNINLGVLLLEFLELYGRVFQYDNVAIRSSEKSSEYEYCTKDSIYAFSSKNMDSARGRLCIEDPFIRGLDVSKGSFQAPNMAEAFDWAYTILSTYFAETSLEEPCKTSVLGQIVKISEEVLDFRDWVVRHHELRSSSHSPCASPTTKPRTREIRYSPSSPERRSHPPKTATQDVTQYYNYAPPPKKMANEARQNVRYWSHPTEGHSQRKRKRGNETQEEVGYPHPSTDGYSKKWNNGMDKNFSSRKFPNRRRAPRSSFVERFKGYRYNPEKLRVY